MTQAIDRNAPVSHLNINTKIDDDIDNKNGYEFLRELCRNIISDLRKGGNGRKRPLSSAFRGVPRDRLLIYVRNHKLNRFRT